MRHRVLALLVPIGLLAATSASAQLLPFGPNPVATFGGTGIPNTQLVNGGYGGVVLSLGAHNRCSTGLPTDGAGTYFASPGRYNPANLGYTPTGTCAATPDYATWNFNFYIGGGNPSLYSYVLQWELRSSPTTVFGIPKGSWAFNWADVSDGVTDGKFQNSWNLGMPSPMGSSSFDYNTAGVYSFELAQYANTWDPILGRDPLGRVEMNVSVTPEPATMLLLGTGLLGLAAAGLRRRKVRSAEV